MAQAKSASFKLRVGEIYILTPTSDSDSQPLETSLTLVGNRSIFFFIKSHWQQLAAVV